MTPPLVSCLMVTADRARLAERAVRCFCAQTWPHRELIIVDDGAEDYGPMLSAYRRAATIRYERVPRDERRRLGALRNLSVDHARGEYCTQWDDDEWYHPRRLDAQVKPLIGRAGATVLRHTLMHLDTPEFLERPYRTALRRGTPGTAVFSRTNLRYPNAARGEDTDFLDQLRKSMPVTILGRDFSHLFIRCFHGSNTWSREHFAERLHYTFRNKLEYAYARWIRRDLFAHQAFQLTDAERASARTFLEESRGLGLCT
jgi:glycosyltransferase involved in cell wall biosynthesis